MLFSTSRAKFIVHRYKFKIKNEVTAFKIKYSFLFIKIFTKKNQCSKHFTKKKLVFPTLWGTVAQGTILQTREENKEGKRKNRRIAEEEEDSER